MSCETPAKANRDRSGSLSALLTNIGWLLGGRGVAAVLSTVYIALIARSLGPSGFGQFALIVSIAQALVAIVGFQTWQIIVRFGMEALQARQVQRLARLVRMCVLLDIGGAIVGSLIAITAITLLDHQFGWTANVKLDAMILCLVSLVAVRSTPTGILRLHDRFDVAAYVDAVLPIVRFAGAIIVWATGPNLHGFLMVWAIAELTSAAAFWWGAGRHIRGLIGRSSRLEWTLLKRENPGLLAFAGVTNAGQTFMLASRQLPVLLVGYFLTPAAAGGFRLAYQLAQALAKVSQLAARALLPELMRARTFSGDSDHFGRLLARSIRLSAIAGVVIIALLLIVGKPLLLIMGGEAFLPAYPLLLLLGTAASIDLIGVGCEPALMATGRAGLLFRIQLTVALALVGLLVVLISVWGTAGAGAAMLAGSLLSFIFLTIATRRAVWRREEPVSSSDASSFKKTKEDIDRTEAR